MRGNRRELLVLLEQQPRRIRELAAATNMTVSAVKEALREFKALGVVCSTPARKRGAGHRAPHVYGVFGVDLSAFA